ncbi:MAG: DUF554 domain-containing protein [Lachnospiraceae bacterium]|nr:DUF554 domain-containing protein [Lachnospiraceae bacterium]
MAAGTFLGCALKKYITQPLNESIMLALSVIAAAVGVNLLGKGVHMSAAALALLIGGVIGHILGIDRRLAGLSECLPKTGGAETAQTLLVAFTLYCVSTTGIIERSRSALRVIPRSLRQKRSWTVPPQCFLRSGADRFWR